MTFIFSQIAVCNSFERKYKISSEGRNDYCSYLLSSMQFMMENGRVNIYAAETLLILCTLLPYIVYFAIVTFMEPHDCFDCFNRIPVLRYSIFQFTIYERNINREQKMGLGYVKMYKSMIKQAEESSRGTYVRDF